MAISILLSLAATAWITAVCAALGDIALGRRANAAYAGVLALLVRFGLGFGILGTTSMGLGFAQQLTPVNLVILIVCGSVAIPFSAGSLWNSFDSSVIRPLCSVARSHPVLTTWTIIIYGAYAAQGMLPPVGFDALMYHLTTVKLYLQHGGFYDIAFNAQSDFPMLSEMMYGIGIALGNDIICKGLAAVIGLSAAAAITVLSRTVLNLDHKSTLFSLILFGTFTVTIANLSTCDVDVAQALWTLISVIVLVDYLKTERRRSLWISAFFAGMAVQTKIFGIFVVPVLWTVLATWRSTAVPFSKRLQAGLITAGTAIAFGTPWYLKSLAYTGTILSLPLKPTALIPVASTVGHSALASLFGALVHLLSVPWSFSLFPSVHRYDSFGALPLAVLPFLLLSKPSRAVQWVLWAVAAFWIQLVGMEVLFGIQSSIRYAFFLTVCFAPLVLFTITRTGQLNAVKRMLTGMIMVMAILGTMLLLKRYHGEWWALLTNQSRQEYYTSVLPAYPAIAYINALEDPGTILTVYDFDTYLIDKPLRTATRDWPSRTNAMDDLDRANVQYIFANNRLNPSENLTAFPEIPEKTMVFSTNDFCVYRIDR